MKEIIEKILEEVDPDIKELMLSDSDEKFISKEGFFKKYQLLGEPALTILHWQELRDRKNK